MKTWTTDLLHQMSSEMMRHFRKFHGLNIYSVFNRKKRVSVQGLPEKNKLSNSISQSKMNTEPKVVSTQTTISSTVAASEVKPQQVQAQTPDHKMYVTEMRKELSEAATTTPLWTPGNMGNLMVRNHIEPLNVQPFNVRFT